MLLQINIFLIIDLDSILQKEDEPFNSINKCRSLLVEVSPKSFLTINCVIDIEYLENRLGQITAGACYISIIKIISSCQKDESGILLIVNCTALG